LLIKLTRNLRPVWILWINNGKKMDMRFGTGNVRSMYRAGSLRAVVKEFSKYK
jgi:hypothetical protein